MVTAVDLRFLSKTDPDLNEFFIEFANRLIKNFSQGQFIIFINKNFDYSLIQSDNVSFKIINSIYNNLLAQSSWYNIKLPLLLKEYKADIFISANNLSLKSKLLQYLIVNDIKKVPANKFLQKAYSIISTSCHDKEALIKKYEVEEKKIEVIQQGINKLFAPIDWEEKEKIKKTYSRGTDYFLLIISPNFKNNLINILKAFSLFKKWQKSNLQLLILDKYDLLDNKFFKSLENYKYKQDVTLLSDDIEFKDIALITAGAYGVINVLDKFFEISIIESIKCYAPVILCTTTQFADIPEHTVLYAHPENVDNIASQMIALYKDEKKRNELIEQGLLLAEKYNWDKSIDLLQQSILKAITA